MVRSGRGPIADLDEVQNRNVSAGDDYVVRAGWHTFSEHSSNTKKSTPTARRVFSSHVFGASTSAAKQPQLLKFAHLVCPLNCILEHHHQDESAIPRSGCDSMVRGHSQRHPVGCVDDGTPRRCPSPPTPSRPSVRSP